MEDLISDEEKLHEYLAAAFGEDKAKKLIKKIKKIKAKNPHTKYSFFFNEDGTLVTAQKKPVDLEGN